LLNQCKTQKKQLAASPPTTSFNQDPSLTSGKLEQEEDEETPHIPFPLKLTGRKQVKPPFIPSINMKEVFEVAK